MSATDRAYHREMQRRRMAEKRAGIVHTVPASDVLPHVRMLIDSGLTPARIAVAAGVSVKSVTRIVRGLVNRPQAATAQAILAVTPATARAAAGPADRVPAVGTRRRLQALQALGWRHQDLSARTGHDTGSLIRETRLVRRETADAVARVYDELWNQQGPSATTRTRARGRGWAVPMAWDDDQIDDPAATPMGVRREAARPHGEVDDVAVQRAIDKGGMKLTVAEREIAVARLAERDWSDRQIAHHLSCAPETVLRIRHRLGIETRWTA